MIRVQRSLVLARRLERDSLVQSGAGILGIHEGGLIKILCGSLVPLLDMGQDTQTIKRNGILPARLPKTLAAQ